MARVYTSPDDEIRVPVGETFTIELEGNPTTGYDWEIQLDDDKVQLVDRQYAPARPGTFGASGKERVKVRASKDGETTIHAVYKRAWESQAAEEKTFRVRIQKR